MTQRDTLRFVCLSALSAAFAAPVAFAQESGAAPSEPTPRPATPTQPAQPPQKTWAELDTDRDGDLSREEAAAIPSLQSVFDRADANADGALTGQEYKAYLAANGKPATPAMPATPEKKK